MYIYKGQTIERGASQYSVVMKDGEYVLLAPIITQENDDGDITRTIAMTSLELYDANDDFEELGFKEVK